MPKNENNDRFCGGGEGVTGGFGREGATGGFSGEGVSGLPARPSGGLGAAAGFCARCCWAAACIFCSSWNRRVASAFLLAGALLGCMFLAFCR